MDKDRIDKILANLDPEEQELLESIERGEWRSVPNLEQELERHRQIAANTLKAMRKDQRVNIRLSRQDLEALQVRALEEGIPYQTLMSSILHKYVTGRLVEKNR